MDSTNGEKKPLHHPHPHSHHNHHHLFYISSHCPLHRPILHPNNHSPYCFFSTSYPSPQYPQPEPQPGASIPPNPQSTLLDDINPSHTFNHVQTMPDEIEKVEVEEEDDEPIFVLTDEWRDFFAKSEAKRRLAKQAKKGKK